MKVVQRAHVVQLERFVQGVHVLPVLPERHRAAGSRVVRQQKLVAERPAARRDKPARMRHALAIPAMTA